MRLKGSDLRYEPDDRGAEHADEGERKRPYPGARLKRWSIERKVGLPTLAMKRGWGFFLLESPPRREFIHIRRVDRGCAGRDDEGIWAFEPLLDRRWVHGSQGKHG